uniref:RRM domain-containing protein n=1 Tax=Ganoderma boninense TaxID=34458 RepID=A0A5K1K1Y2_9APHY|nr:RRM domain-containing protein [Ganoderma boninense]
MADDLSEADIGLIDLSSSQLSSKPRLPAFGRIPSAGGSQPSLGLGIPSSASMMNGQLKASSSPDLAERPLPDPNDNLAANPRRRVSRSKTVRVPRRMHRTQLSLDGLLMGTEKIAKLRRWILSLVTGEWLFWHKRDVAFSSFPDSSQFEDGSQTHSFRIRLHGPVDGEAWETESIRPSTADGFIYGFSCFTRTKDAGSKRGYQQTSIVILSHLAYPSLFYTLVSKLAPSFMTHGGPMLEAACHNVANWPDPTPGTILELGFLGTVIHVELPEVIEIQQSMSALSPGRVIETDIQILASICPSDPPILDQFAAVISHMWSIWECLVLSEPILVFGSSSVTTSRAVWWLRDLLRPIPLSGDFRPFFTIHDADHTALINPRPPQAGLLVGVTNPFFDKACKHWPNMLRLGRPETAQEKKNGPNSPAAFGPLPGWRSTHKRYTSRDHTLLRQLEVACQGSEQSKYVASEALRQHFAARTTALLVPLQRYLQTLIPTPSESRSPLPNGARLKPFHDAAFFSSLKAHGSPLPFKSSSKQPQFYFLPSAVLPEPLELAADAVPGTFQPSHVTMTFLAKISPNPSMTPFTNGSSTLIATLESSASARVFGLSVGSNIESVAVRTGSSGGWEG